MKGFYLISTFFICLVTCFPVNAMKNTPFSVRTKRVPTRCHSAGDVCDNNVRTNVRNIEDDTYKHPYPVYAMKQKPPSVVKIERAPSPSDDDGEKFCIDIKETVGSRKDQNSRYILDFGRTLVALCIRLSQIDNNPSNLVANKWEKSLDTLFNKLSADDGKICGIRAFYVGSIGLSLVSSMVEPILDKNKLHDLSLNAYSGL